MPVLPASLVEPLWVQFSDLLPERPRVAPSHPLGCYPERIPDRLVFAHSQRVPGTVLRPAVVAALVHGSGYERIATVGCSARAIRRRLQDWASVGLVEQMHRLTLEAYDRMIGLDLNDLAVDGCISKAPTGGEAAGRSPVDRGKQGLTRSVLTEGAGVPLHLIPAGAIRHAAPLLPATLAGLEQGAAITDAEPGMLHLDQGYAGSPTRTLLDALSLQRVIAQKGVSAPRHAGSRWTVERTQSWMNGYGKLRRCTETRLVVVQFSLFLAAALVVLRRLIQEARLRYRWPARPTTRHLRKRLLPVAHNPLEGAAAFVPPPEKCQPPPVGRTPACRLRSADRLTLCALRSRQGRRQPHQARECTHRQST